MKEEKKLKIENNSTPSYFKSKDLNKNPKTKTSFVEINEVEYWKPTMELRWRELKEWDNGKYVGGDERKVLEQQWINNLGEVEWREIPTV